MILDSENRQSQARRSAQRFLLSVYIRKNPTQPPGEIFLNFCNIRGALPCGILAGDLVT
jgi:hypothetical protein